MYSCALRAPDDKWKKADQSGHVVEVHLQDDIGVADNKREDDKVVQRRVAPVQVEVPNLSGRVVQETDSSA